MNNGTAELPAARSYGSDAPDAFAKLEKELLQAEVRLAKALATVTGAGVFVVVAVDASARGSTAELNCQADWAPSMKNLSNPADV